MQISNFTTIAFTTPDILVGPKAIKEAEALCRLLQAGTVDIMHIRKPEANEEQMAAYLGLFPEEFLQRASIHSYFHLAESFNVGGFHLNSRWPEVDASLLADGFRRKRRLSRSMHSLAELENYLEEEKREPSARYTYVTLSPVFDSISKTGYASAFDLGSDQALKELTPLLERMAEADTPVMALGGVTPRHFKTLADVGFGGAAMLGYLWDAANGGIPEIEKNIKEQRYVTVYHQF